MKGGDLEVTALRTSCSANEKSAPNLQHIFCNQVELELGQIDLNPFIWDSRAEKWIDHVLPLELRSKIGFLVLTKPERDDMRREQLPINPKAGALRSAKGRRMQGGDSHQRALSQNRGGGGDG